MADEPSEITAAVLDCLAAIEERLAAIEERLATESPDLTAAILDAVADVDERITELTTALDIDALAKQVADRLEQRFEVVPDEPVQ